MFGVAFSNFIVLRAKHNIGVCDSTLWTVHLVLKVVSKCWHGCVVRDKADNLTAFVGRGIGAGNRN